MGGIARYNLCYDPASSGPGTKASPRTLNHANFTSRFFDREQSLASRGGREGAGYPNLCGSSGAICLRLNTGWAVGSFTAIVLLCAAALLIETIDIAGSETLGASMNLSSLTRATSLWPGNPETHYRLGMLRLNSGDRRIVGRRFGAYTGLQNWGLCGCGTGACLRGHANPRETASARTTPSAEYKS